jgi:hypothetical protein
VFLFFPEQVLSINYVNLHVVFAVLVVGSGSRLQSFWGLCFSILKHLEIAIVLPWQGLYCSQASAELMRHTLDAITSAELMIVYTWLQLPLQNWWCNTHGYNCILFCCSFCIKDVHYTNGLDHHKFLKAQRHGLLCYRLTFIDYLRACPTAAAKWSFPYILDEILQSNGVKLLWAGRICAC